jgi:hypothetical protein
VSALQGGPLTRADLVSPHTKVPSADTMPRLGDSPPLWTCHPPPKRPSAASSPEAYSNAWHRIGTNPAKAQKPSINARAARNG